MTYHRTPRPHLTCDPSYSGPREPCTATVTERTTAEALRRYARELGWQIRTSQPKGDRCPAHALPANRTSPYGRSPR